MTLDVEGVLARHQSRLAASTINEPLRMECCCGFDLGPTQGSGTRHRAHVAAVLREQIAAAQAEAWDEGAIRVWQSLAEHAWTLEFYTDDNPYRAALVACVDPSPSESGSTDPEVRQSADQTSSPSRVPGEET
jgi:hypothetical protein